MRSRTRGSDVVAEGADKKRLISDGAADQRCRHQLLVEWNRTTTDYPRNICIHELFAQQASRTPEAVAVVLGNEFLTYQDLDHRANQLAHYLPEFRGWSGSCSWCMYRALSGNDRCTVRDS